MASKDEKNISTFTDTEIGIQGEGIQNEGGSASTSGSIRTAEAVRPCLQRKLEARHVQVMSHIFLYGFDRYIESSKYILMPYLSIMHGKYTCR